MSDITLRDVRAALALLSRRMPFLAPYAARCQVKFDATVPTACVDDHGLIHLSRSYFAALGTDERVGLLAHELLHLRLATAERLGARNRLRFNIAHDYVINDYLERELGVRLPPEGLRRRNARHSCAERLYRHAPEPREPTTFERFRQTKAWKAHLSHGGESLAYSTDPLPPEDVEQVVVVFGVPSAEEVLHLARTDVRPELLDLARRTAPPGRRSFARVSRRRAHIEPFAFPGRAPTTAPLHLLVDTSSSMLVRLAHYLQQLLTALSAAGHEQVAVTFADGEVIRHAELPTRIPKQGMDLRVEGRGDYELVVMPERCDGCDAYHAYANPQARPTDLNPALRRIQTIGPASLIVLTDGLIELPRHRAASDVTWVLPQAAEGLSPGPERVIILH